jgi:hypothetical protein
MTMTHAITDRVVRTFLSLLALCACATPPVLTAAMPATAFARWPVADGDSRNANAPGPLGRDLDRPAQPPPDLPFGPFALPAATCDPPVPTLPPTLFEVIEGRLKAQAVVDTPIPTGAQPGTAAHLGPHPDVWANAAPLLLLDWSGRRDDPGLRLDGVQRVAKSKADGEWGALTSKVALRERDDPLDPSRCNTWETDESVRMPVAGSLFLFGQLGASSPSVEQQQHKWLGKTGVGVKLKPWLLEEVQVRGGPAVRYDDTGTLSRGQSPERSELFLEAVTKLPLPVVGPLNVEYTSYAVPAATASDRNQINQDFKVALPLSGGGQVHVGAKYKWENAPSSTPWVDRMQLYMGVQLNR